jgi:glycine/D-amino acid oxidase-like deaminating enzyme
VHCKTSSEIRGAWPAKFRGEDVYSSLSHAVASIVPSAKTSDTTPCLGEFNNKTAYLNPHSGWAEAGRAVAVGLRRITHEFGGIVRSGCEVRGLIEDEGKDGKKVVKGVQLTTGEKVTGDIVIIATGAWTPALFAQDGMGQLPQIVATG